jgi:hypothetical protein
VEVAINPFTYKFCQKNKKEFKDDEIVLQLLESSENRGLEFGFVSMVFREEYRNKEVLKRAEKHKEYAQEAIIRMHKLVMKELDIASAPAFIIKVK